MMTYHVTKVKDQQDFLSRVNTLPRAYVTHYPWNCEYRPETYGVLGRDDENIYLYMRSYDVNRRAETGCDNGEIYMDSCMEFFFNPCPGARDVFFNLEMNPRRFLYLAFGTPDRNNRKLYTTDEYNHFDLKIRDKESALAGDYWDVSARIPFKFISRVMPEFKPAQSMRFTGNFFKCGDGTKIPHFGCWSEIIPDSPNPDFYKTEYFGEILFD